MDSEGPVGLGSPSSELPSPGDLPLYSMCIQTAPAPSALSSWAIPCPANEQRAASARDACEASAGKPQEEKEPADRVTINVAGLHFETHRSTLARFPGTLLGDPARRDRYYSARREEVFLDRHPDTFPSVLYFYQSGGVLKRPLHVPFDIFVKELEFYDLGDEAMSSFHEEEGYLPLKVIELPTRRAQRILWQLMEHPDSSVLAQIVSIVSLLFVFISIVVFCVGTLPGFQTDGFAQSYATNGAAAGNASGANSTGGNGTSGNGTAVANALTFAGGPLFTTETVCVAWFCLEIVLRYVSCPSKLAFFRVPMNVVDIVVVVPYFITLGIDVANMDSVNGQHTVSLAVFRVFRLLRVLRILKLSRYFKGLRILAKTLTSSIREILVLFIFLLIGVVLFASAVYFAESDQPNTAFRSIPESFWWAVVTMTTVGYGDMTPVTAGGKVVGSLCAVSGVLMMALPVPVIVNKFTLYYELDRKQQLLLRRPANGGGADARLSQRVTMALDQVCECGGRRGSARAA
ncbi:potassium voltage-gated channel subfamily A member 7-like [Petromyzon marinus]|uniref:potassium voltage-gated channel subfamily A member 7-like n=1 Tax=Petromyzon marinus TaxID=7757 RepID=UPI003F701170